MALGGYVLVRELQSLPPPTKHPIQVAGAIPSAVKFDEDPSHYCHFIPPSSTINQENPNTWTDIDVPIGFRICMDPYDESQLKVQCRKFYTDQWSECNGEKAVSIRFKSNIPIVTWFEKIRPI